MNTAFAECSNSLLALLSTISPKLESTKKATMVGSIVASSVSNEATNLQLFLSVLLTQK